MMIGNDDERVMRNLCARTILEHRKRGRESEAFAMAFLFDSAEVGKSSACATRGRGPGAATLLGAPRTTAACGEECSWATWRP